MISQKVVDACGLQQKGTGTIVQVIGEAEDVPRYLISLYLPNKVVVPELLVSLGKFRDFDVLVGMDIIGRGDFAVTNSEGQTKFTFRIPSQGGIDFVAESRKANIPSLRSSPSQQTRERNRRKRKK